MFPWWVDTVTVYNKFEDPQTGVIRWYRTVLTNCFWQNQFQRLTVGQLEVTTDATVCRIPQKSNYSPRHEWINMPNDAMADYFTLANGDIIIKGEVNDTIDEYTAGSRATDVITKYKSQGCLVIDKFNDNTGAGRGLLHYHVEGAPYGIRRTTI